MQGTSDGYIYQHAYRYQPHTCFMSAKVKGFKPNAANDKLFLACGTVQSSLCPRLYESEHYTNLTRMCCRCMYAQLIVCQHVHKSCLSGIVKPKEEDFRILLVQACKGRQQGSKESTRNPLEKGLHTDKGLYTIKLTKVAERRVEPVYDEHS